MELLGELLEGMWAGKLLVSLLNNGSRGGGWDQAGGRG